MRRGEIWWAALDPTVGAEIQKTRPCMIVSPNVLIDGLRTVIVAPLTSRGQALSFRPKMKFRRTEGMVALDQLRTLDKRRLLRRMGIADDKTVSTVLRMLRWIFTE